MENLNTSNFTISIIGTSGRGDNFIKLLPDHWPKMCNKSEEYIQSIVNNSWEKVILVSGGAAWADHIAVDLYLKHPESQLVLHLPAKWETSKEQFKQNNKAGSLSNTLHK